MKKIILLLLTMSVAISASAAGKKHKLTKTTGFDRKIMYEIKTPEEFKVISRQVKQEQMLHRKALGQAKKQWAKNPENKRTFPGASVSKRSVKQMGKDYTDRNKARERLYKYQDKEAEKKQQDERVLKKIYRKMRKAEGLGNKEKPKAQIEAEEKKAMYDRARALYCQKLFALIQGG